MKIAFMHYHLKTGGVTTCLRQQVQALKNDCEILVITGEKPDGAFPADTVHIPQLAYSDVYRGAVNPQDIALAVINAIQTRFNGPCDILHVHNPLLAKNRAFLKILNALQKRGIPLLLQIHDFAEDGRPLSYFHEDYPADCHYCVVNSRDYHILLKSGLKPKGLHQIFNAVDHPGSRPESSAVGPYVVYPIRAIRRKNIGEAILLSFFFEKDQMLVITLPPNSPVDIESYKSWKEFVADHRLCVEFERGLKHPFEAVVHSARYLLTTSITEGFGFSFLEPWLYGKWVWGRKLFDICSDFEANGVCLDHMYKELNVPLDWIDSDRFLKKWSYTIQNICRLFDLQIHNSRMKSAYDTITANGAIDFGLLDEAFQKKVILRLLADKASRGKICCLNPFLAGIGKPADEKAVMQANRDAVVRNYSMARYRQNLLAIYARVRTVPVQQRIDKKTLLAEFLDLKKISLLKWGGYGA